MRFKSLIVSRILTRSAWWIISVADSYAKTYGGYERENYSLKIPFSFQSKV